MGCIVPFATSDLHLPGPRRIIDFVHDALADGRRRCSRRDSRVQFRNGPRKTAMMHVFGIIFAEEVDRYGGAAIAREAGQPNPAALTDGRNLAEYVAVNPGELKRLLKL